MNNTPALFSKVDPEAQRKKALAKIYELLMKLAEEKENVTDKEKAEPLKSNIPVGR